MRYRRGQRVDLRIPFPDAEHSVEDLRAIAAHPASSWEHREAAVDMLIAQGETWSGRSVERIGNLPPEHRWLGRWTELMSAASAAVAGTYAGVDIEGGPKKCTWLKAGDQWVVRGPIDVVKPGAVVLVHRGDGTAAGTRIRLLGPIVGGAQIGYV